MGSCPFSLAECVDFFIILFIIKYLRCEALFARITVTTSVLVTVYNLEYFQQKLLAKTFVDRFF